MRPVRADGERSHRARLLPQQGAAACSSIAASSKRCCNWKAAEGVLSRVAASTGPSLVPPRLPGIPCPRLCKDAHERTRDADRRARFARQSLSGTGGGAGEKPARHPAISICVRTAPASGSTAVSWRRSAGAARSAPAPAAHPQPPSDFDLTQSAFGVGHSCSCSSPVCRWRPGNRAPAGRFW